MTYFSFYRPFCVSQISIWCHCTFVYKYWYEIDFSGLISDVNIDNPAKSCEISISRSCISRKQATCAFLDFADPWSDEQNYFLIWCFPMWLDIWWVVYQPQMPVCCQNEQMPLTVKAPNRFLSLGIWKWGKAELHAIDKT